MKYITVILLTLFVLQSYGLPHPTLTRSASENVDLNSNVESKDTTKEPNSIATNTKTEQKSTSDIAEISDNIRLESKSLSDSSSTNAVKDEKSSVVSTQENSNTDSKNKELTKPKNVGIESKKPTSESKKTKVIDKLSSTPQEIPTSRSNKDNEESFSENLITGASSGSNSIPELTKIETMQRPPSYYYDMFNIPIAALQAVSNFLGGSPTSPTYIRPTATSRPPVAKENLRSPPIETLTGTSGVEPASSSNTNSPNISSLQGLMAQIGQFASNRPGVVGLQIFRIPTIQDIINIPISTLNAVSHFLASNYAAQAAPVVSSPPAEAASNVVPSKVPIEATAAPNKELVKSALLQTLDNIPDHSTLIGVTQVDAKDEQTTSVVQAKQDLIAKPEYYQAMMNIPIETLKAVNIFLASVSADPSLIAHPAVIQENKINADELSLPSIKTAQVAAQVTWDASAASVNRKARGIPQIIEGKASGKIVNGRSKENPMVAKK